MDYDATGRTLHLYYNTASGTDVAAADLNNAIAAAGGGIFTANSTLGIGDDATSVTSANIAGGTNPRSTGALTFRLTGSKGLANVHF